MWTNDWMDEWANDWMDEWAKARRNKNAIFDVKIAFFFGGGQSQGGANKRHFEGTSKASLRHF